MNKMMTKRNLIFAMVFSSVFGGLVAVGGYVLLVPQPESRAIPVNTESSASFTNYILDTTDFVVPEGLNFVYASQTATNTVVHIRTTYEGGSRPDNPFDDYFRDFFGQPDRPRNPGRGSGSGVIVNSDGYIVTNNHVIDNASEIEVLLNDNRTYEAEVVGVDPTTDLAVIRINEKNLPSLKWGNSDEINVGEWVLAVGNPYEFRSTVTAGIVSAKARNINIIRRNNDLSIESFIQTDAAVNPGNSGGALVNLRGELVGINTAIISPTGAFAGYSFAVPVSLVKKVYEDLTEYGTVQRALLGIRIIDVNADLAEAEGLDVIQGVYISSVNDGSAADDAGLYSGDVIVGVNGKEVNNTSELQEQIALNRPGEDVTITYVRDGRTRDVKTTLKNASNTTAVVVETRDQYSISGAEFEEVSLEEKEELDIDGGVKITNIGSGKFREVGIRPGFIITKVDKNEIDDLDDFRSYIESARGEGILIEGMYPNGEKQYYGIGW